MISMIQLFNALKKRGTIQERYIVIRFNVVGRKSYGRLSVANP